MSVLGTRFNQVHFEGICYRLEGAHGYGTLILLKQDHPIVWREIKKNLNATQLWDPQAVATAMRVWLEFISLDPPESTRSKTGDSRSPPLVDYDPSLERGKSGFGDPSPVDCSERKNS